MLLSFYCDVEERTYCRVSICQSQYLDKVEGVHNGEWTTLWIFQL